MAHYIAALKQNDKHSTHSSRLSSSVWTCTRIICAYSKMCNIVHRWPSVNDYLFNGMYGPKIRWGSNIGKVKLLSSKGGCVMFYEKITLRDPQI